MKLWLSYKFRGADWDQLRQQLAELRNLLEDRGHQVVTMIEDIQDWDLSRHSKQELLRLQYAMVKGCDAALCLYITDDPSEGRGFDAGLMAGMGKPIIMAIHEPLSIPFTEAFYSENPANQGFAYGPVIRFKTFQDIADQL